LFLQCLFLQILVVNKVKDQVDQVQMVNKAKALTVRRQVAQQELSTAAWSSKTASKLPSTRLCAAAKITLSSEELRKR
jgi:hypothetical protein